MSRLDAAVRASGAVVTRLDGSAWRITTGAPTRVAVLRCLAAHGKGGKAPAWPSVGTIAKYVKVSERTARQALRDLQAEGLIEPVGGVSKGGRPSTRSAEKPQTTQWRLTVSGTANPATPSPHDLSEGSPNPATLSPSNPAAIADESLREGRAPGTGAGSRRSPGRPACGDELVRFWNGSACSPFTREHETVAAVMDSDLTLLTAAELDTLEHVLHGRLPADALATVAARVSMLRGAA